jgi:pimeloyl-ACP methyl ester carboxylesterase
VPRTRSLPRLWYRRRGQGEPLLLITGFTISAAVFDPILPLYEPHFECIVYDHRASGRSDKPPLLTSMAELAGDAARVLDELGIESAHVSGLSMGGMVAQEMAIRFPERVRGLMLGCSTPGGPRAIRPSLKELGTLGVTTVKALREPGRPWLSAALFSDEFRREHPERVRELLRLFAKHRAPAYGALAHLMASVYHDTTSRLHLIEAPTLVMHGERDQMAPLANARMLAGRIPDAELAIVPGAGHAYGLEAPQLSLDLVLDWLRRRGPIQAGRPRQGLIAQAEPVTRALGLPIGALRTGASLAGLVADKIGGGGDVAVDRRTA